MRRVFSVATASLWLVCGPAWAQTPARQDLFRAGPETYAPRFDPVRDHRPAPGPLVPYAVVLDDVVRGDSARDERARRARRTDAGPRGSLRLLVQPTSSQVFVDGYFVGTIEDFAGNSWPIVEAGTHRVELRAPGYETAAFDIAVEPDETTTYRRELMAIGNQSWPSATAPQPAPATEARTFYIIPRCYAGDAPPQAVHLPPGCEVANARTVPGAGAGQREPRAAAR